MIKLTDTAKEQGTIIIPVSFADENGDDVIPSNVLWSLVDQIGTVINNREQVSVTPSAATIDIVLSGDDLSLQTHEKYQTKVYRNLVVEATYDSDAGSDLKINDSIRFKIENLIYVE